MSLSRPLLDTNQAAVTDRQTDIGTSTMTVNYDINLSESNGGQSIAFSLTMTSSNNSAFGNVNYLTKRTKVGGRKFRNKD